jgi:hypothetical protein
MTMNNLKGHLYTFSLDTPLQGNFIVIMQTRRNQHKAIYFIVGDNMNVSLDVDKVKKLIDTKKLLFVEEISKKIYKELKIAWKHNYKENKIATINLESILNG